MDAWYWFEDISGQLALSSYNWRGIEISEEWDTAVETLEGAQRGSSVTNTYPGRIERTMELLGGLDQDHLPFHHLHLHPLQFLAQKILSSFFE